MALQAWKGCVMYGVAYGTRSVVELIDAVPVGFRDVHLGIRFGNRRDSALNHVWLGSPCEFLAVVAAEGPLRCRVLGVGAWWAVLPVWVWGEFLQLAGVRDHLGAYSFYASNLPDDVVRPYGSTSLRSFTLTQQLKKESAGGRLPNASPVSHDLAAPSTLQLKGSYTADEARQRFRAGKFDARDTLTGYDSDMQSRRSVEVGRSWTDRHAWMWGFHPSVAGWGASRVVLEPSFAGLVSPVIDSGTTSSWSSLLTMLGEGVTPANNALLGHLRASHNSEVNPVRFVTRLAAMYVLARQLEECGDHLRVDTVVLPDIRRLNVSADIARLLDDSRSGSGVVYFKSGIDTFADQQSLGILALAAAPRIKWLTPEAMTLERFWPALPPMIVAVSGMAPGPITGIISSSQVWLTAVEWCAYYSTTELFKEAVEYLVTMAYSPHELNPIVLSTRVQCYLPMAQMQGYALGPLMARLAQPEVSEFIPPDFAALVGECIHKARMLGLLHWYVLWMGILAAKEHVDFSAEDARIAWLWYRMGRHGSTGWGMIIGALDSYLEKGFGTGKVGRFLTGTLPGIVVQTEGMASRSLVADMTPNDHYKRLMKKRGKMLQWEEIIGTGLLVPEMSAIWGFLFPLYIEPASYERSMWGFPHVIKGNRTLAECCMSVATIAPGVEWKKLVSAQNGERIRMDWTPYEAYNGRVADYQFYPYANRNGVLYQPIFCVRDLSEFHTLTHEDCFRYHLKWFADIPDGITPVVGAPTWVPNFDGPPPPADYDSDGDSSGPDDEGLRPEPSSSSGMASPKVPVGPPTTDTPDVAPLDVDDTPLPAKAGTKLDPKTVTMESLDTLIGETLFTTTLQACLAMQDDSYAAADAKDAVAMKVLDELREMNVVDYVRKARPNKRAYAARQLARCIGYAAGVVSTSPEVTKDIDVLGQAAKNLAVAMDADSALTLDEFRGRWTAKQLAKLEAEGRVPLEREIQAAALTGTGATALSVAPDERLRRLIRVGRLWRDELMVGTTPFTADVLAERLGDHIDEYLDSKEDEEAAAEDAAAVVAATEEATAASSFLGVARGGDMGVRPGSGMSQRSTATVVSPLPPPPASTLGQLGGVAPTTTSAGKMQSAASTIAGGAEQRVREPPMPPDPVTTSAGAAAAGRRKKPSAPVNTSGGQQTSAGGGRTSSSGGRPHSGSAPSSADIGTGGTWSATFAPPKRS